MQAPGPDSLTPVRTDWPNSRQVGAEPSTSDGTPGKSFEKPSRDTPPLDRRSTTLVRSETGAIRQLLVKFALHQSADESAAARQEPQPEVSDQASKTSTQSVVTEEGSRVTLEGDRTVASSERAWVKEACSLTAKLLPEYRRDPTAFLEQVAGTEFRLGQGTVRRAALSHQVRLGIETIAQEKPEFYAENKEFFVALEKAFPREAGDIDPDKSGVLEGLRLGLNERATESPSLEAKSQDFSRRFKALAVLRAADELRFEEQWLQNQLRRFTGSLETFAELELCAEHCPDQLPIIQERQRELAQNTDFSAILRQVGDKFTDEQSLFDLKRLTLSELQDIPPELGAFPELKTIDLVNCHSPRLPTSFALPGNNLEFLRLYRCGLEELPRYIGGFTNLRELSIQGNPIKTLPLEITRCTNLRILRISDTEIRPAQLQPEIIDWIRRQHVGVAFNPELRAEWAAVGIP